MAATATLVAARARPGLLQLLGVDGVGGDGCAGNVGQEVEEQDLARQQRQEGQEGGGRRHAEHVAEVGAGRHPDVLEGVGERLAAEPNPVGDDAEALVEEDDRR
jgi:hypothetical protein